MELNFFSPAQCVGYVAFVLGVTAFLQKIDWKLKCFNGLECVAYAVHFTMLGHFPAVVSAIVSSIRSFVGIRCQSKIVSVVLIVCVFVPGIYLTKVPTDLLTVLSSCIATWGVFTMKGIPLRLAFLVCTFCWLANNILTGSIGGTCLESFIAVSNISTIVRMSLASRRERFAPSGDFSAPTEAGGETIVA